ncbi:hypothetical protein [Microtetraspora niveoalba]|uniref:hypothetical protein n=1 Tax=Microtetraspora niveoalba TaxID=46175 RepID=UPI000834BDF3|nr:hypothetical protein [Microtetraspora niveoalba]
MTSDGTGSRSGGRLLALGIIWFVGTPLLAVLAFMFGFALGDNEPANEKAATVLVVAALILGLGAPVVGLLLSLAARNKIGLVGYGLITAAIGVLLYTQVAAPMLAKRTIRVEEPLVCTAPPDRASGVPGC